MKVTFKYKSGRVITMEKRFADILSDLKHGEVVNEAKPTADPVSPVAEVDREVVNEAKPKRKKKSDEE